MNKIKGDNTMNKKGQASFLAGMFFIWLGIIITYGVGSFIMLRWWHWNPIVWRTLLAGSVILSIIISIIEESRW